MKVRYNVRIRAMVKAAGSRVSIYLPGPQVSSNTWRKTYLNSQNVKSAESDSKLVLFDFLEFLEEGIDDGILTGIDKEKVLVWAGIYCGNKLVRVWSGNNRMAGILELSQGVHHFRRPMTRKERDQAVASLPRS